MAVTNGYLVPPPTSLAELIAAKDAAIEREFAGRVTSPISFEVDGGVHLWHADAAAVTNIMGVVLLIAAGVPVPNPRTWTPVGSFDAVAITHAELIGLGATIAARKDVLFTIKKTKQAEVAALTDVDDVREYDVMSGWA